MSIPDYQSIMLPLLRFAGSKKSFSARETVGALSEEFGLTEVERAEMLPSGASTVFANRVAWARTYLKQAGLLVSPKRGVVEITHEGRSVLQKNPTKIDNGFLNQYESFRVFRSKGKSDDSVTLQVNGEVVEPTPEDAMASAYQRLRRELEIELLEQIKSASPAFFERVVVDLLIAMGYGGSRQDAGRAVGKSGDGGIDGIIKEDRLGLDAIYLQAKRWDGVVGRPEVQKFAGPLQGQRANKGVFITTSSYSKEALDYVTHISTKIVLIDGESLVRLMADHDVGVTKIGTYDLKRIDTDYFEAE